MKKTGGLVRTVCMAGVILASVPAPLFAKEAVLGMDQQIYKVLNTAQSLYESNENDAALESLNKGLARYDGRISDYERAHMMNMMAVIYQDTDRADSALDLYRQILQLEKLPTGFLINVYRNAASLSMMQEDYASALLYANKAIEIADPPDPSAYVIVAQAQYYLEHYSPAREAIEHAMALHEASLRQAGEKITPREGWLQLANAIYYSQKDYDAMIALHYRLLEFYPREKYLLNLAALFGELEQTDRQLALTEAVIDGGYIADSNKLMNFASLLLLHNVPYKAAVLIERAIEEEKIDATAKNMDRMGQAWLMAGEYERAIPYLIKGAEKAESGENYIRLANTYMALGRWQETVDALSNALKKGDLTDAGTAYLIRGMAQFRLKSYKGAEKSFARAQQYPSVKKLAPQWQRYMRSEIEKLAALGAS